MSIHVLPPEVAAKIAAGEVVERPANVAKELLENSLDAGATEIRVELREGGQRLLRVTDNGHGIPADEAPLAFTRHATSKLATADDLERIATFGFRGEALYSIAAVSQVTLTTRARNEEFAVQLHLDGGNLTGQSRTGAPIGTTVQVEHLFFNVPARKKFLRKPVTEAGHIASIIQRYALAFPDRRFSLINDGRVVFQTTGSGDLFDVLAKVYSLEIARQMVPIGSGNLPDASPSAASFDDEADSPGQQSTVSSQRSTVGAAGLDDEVDFMALHAPPQIDQLPPPQAAVTGYIGLPSLTRANRGHIDLFVNRRYVEDRTLTQAVVQAYHTLLPVGRYPVAVVFLELDPSQVDVNVHPQKTQVRFAEERRLFSVVQKAVRRALVHHAPIPTVDAPRPAAEPPRGWSSAGVRPQRPALVPDQPAFDLDVASPLPRPADADAVRHDWSQPIPDAAPPTSAPQHAVVAATKLPPLRVVGQVGALYIIAEGPEGVYLIDQHAAHERILYEQFLAQRAHAETGVAQQHLLEPLTLHVGHDLTGQVADHLDELAAVGFGVEPFGGESYLVRAVPAVLSGQDPLAALQEIVASLGRQRNQVGEALEARLVKIICKRAAVKAGQLLSPLEMQELVRQLEQCESPRTCPHGRPTMLQLSAGELEKAFGRV
jgi:DNA mismatch repair protein MutL